MRHVLAFCLVVCLVAAGLPSLAQQIEGNGDVDHQYSSSSRTTSEEVQQLRTELVSQNQTLREQNQSIQELKAMVQQLSQRVESTDANLASASGRQGAHLQTLSYAPVQEEKPAAPGSAPSGEAAKTPLLPQKSPEKKPSSALEWTVAGTRIQLYGHGDVSYDYVDNGITPAMQATTPVLGPDAVPRANNGWLGQVSSNLSYFGIRGSHKLNDYLSGVFQVETEINYSGTPGPTSDMQCRNCIGSRDTFVGAEGPWGAVKIGKEDAPYKRVSSPVDPFLNTIGDSRSIMGNSGGDNRAEFMTRISHAVWYEAPTYKGFSASVLFSPGQNRSSDNSAYARGEPNCSGGNGAFTLSFQNSPNVSEGADLYSVVPPDTNPCNDGSWGNVLSASVTYRGYGLYAFGAYEHHTRVNRTVDLVGDGDEAAWKLGTQYTVKRTGTTGNFVFEHLKRYGPGVDPRLDERTRPHATWLALTQKFTKKDNFNFGWAHAGRTPGDPGFCAPEAPGNCAPGEDPATAPFNVVNNASNLYDIGVKHSFTTKMSTYFVYARQANHLDAHYDLGAVGHGVVVDKRDFIGHGFPGTRLQGVSAGMTFDF